ncbi:uracil-DNA glycosylase [Citricoccus zhacaiensis]|uniref:Uracil-DNA glycosylase n=1 Tax=Citricoccus zhacaiensis TaxID=489142 RepID=A0ABQ2LQF5_9MICC|nr:uracil-DNA glycosylase [Citricoccus zhacaiensis]GGO41896.1 uracil-DNA glycosylase [Citricoccus zhacaiensis]
MDLIAPLDPGWERALASQREALAAVGQNIQARRAAGEQVLPAPEHVLRAFRQPFEQVKVLILGQDPYPTPGHPIGMSFAVDRHVSPLPRSLANIYRELSSDVGIPPAAHGDLTAWADQGVLLLNRVLTVAAGEPASHRRLGWEGITQAAVQALASRGTPLVAILWGADARKMAPVLREHAPQASRVGIVESAHPSPLSARRGFFGSKPFSRTNELLQQAGTTPIDWRIG